MIWSYIRKHQLHDNFVLVAIGLATGCYLLWLPLEHWTTGESVVFTAEAVMRDPSLTQGFTRFTEEVAMVMATLCGLAYIGSSLWGFLWTVNEAGAYRGRDQLLLDPCYVITRKANC